MLKADGGARSARAPGSSSKAQAPVRVAVTGRTVGPPLFESLEVLGSGADPGPLARRPIPDLTTCRRSHRAEPDARVDRPRRRAGPTGAVAARRERRGRRRWLVGPRGRRRGDRRGSWATTCSLLPGLAQRRARRGPQGRRHRRARRRAVRRPAVARLGCPARPRARALAARATRRDRRDGRQAAGRPVHRGHRVGGLLDRPRRARRRHPAARSRARPRGSRWRRPPASCATAGLDEVLLVSDPYHSLRARRHRRELGLDAHASPTSTSPVRGWSEWKRMFREAAGVGLARFIGYRRLLQLSG